MQAVSPPSDSHNGIASFLRMKSLTIRNLGPLAEARVEFLQKNLIIGLQSSGKSCILKTACHCSWVEKRIEMVQSADEFQESAYFIDSLAEYHGMKDYVCEDTFIEYETPQLHFSYDHATRHFSFRWGKNRWQYRRPKISYVPSDRNLVAAIPMWSKLQLENDHLLDFMTDWNIARHAVSKIDNVLNLGLSYWYEPSSNKDSIVLPSGRTIRLSEGSSGVQSLMPLFVHLQYLFDSQYREKNEFRQNYEQKEEGRQLMQMLADHVSDGARVPPGEGSMVRADGMSFYFNSPDKSRQFEKLLASYLQTQRNEIYLEEPEDNLFPPTQCQLVDWLLEKSSTRDNKNMLFVATHSPYVLNEFIKRNASEYRLFVTYPAPDKGKFKVKTLSPEEMHEIYDNGVDLFFNFEAYL